MSKKLTDSEIKKALECCSTYHDVSSCKNCPLDGKCEPNMLEQYALDLINRLQAEVEKCEKELNFANKTIATLQAENERLQNILMCFMYALGKVRKIDDIEEISLIPLMSELNKQYRAELKAEAYKEFAEKLENRILSMLTTATLEEKEIICACIGINNNVLKELVGEDK